MNTRSHFRNALATILSVIWIGGVCIACGPPPAAKSPSGMSRSSFEAERPYDDPPLTEAELTGVRRIQKDSTAAAPSDPLPATPSEPPSRQTVRGYRVQVYSFRDRQTAEAAAQQLQKRLSDLSGVRIYVEEEPPYHKIRIGDCRTKTEAEKLMRLLRTRKGYTDAWIVETLVYP